MIQALAFSGGVHRRLALHQLILQRQREQGLLVETPESTESTRDKVAASCRHCRSCLIKLEASASLSASRWAQFLGTSNLPGAILMACDFLYVIQ